nr:MAG TPA: hypothetical protein [Caudoviricetes sp.]
MPNKTRCWLQSHLDLTAKHKWWWYQQLLLADMPLFQHHQQKLPMNS